MHFCPVPFIQGEIWREEVSPLPYLCIFWALPPKSKIFRVDFSKILFFLPLSPAKRQWPLRVANDPAPNLFEKSRSRIHFLTCWRVSSQIWPFATVFKMTVGVSKFLRTQAKREHWLRRGLSTSILASLRPNRGMISENDLRDLLTSASQVRQLYTEEKKTFRE